MLLCCPNELSFCPKFTQMLNVFGSMVLKLTSLRNRIITHAVHIYAQALMFLSRNAIFRVLTPCSINYFWSWSYWKSLKGLIDPYCFHYFTFCFSGWSHTRYWLLEVTQGSLTHTVSIILLQADSIQGTGYWKLHRSYWDSNRYWDYSKDSEELEAIWIDSWVINPYYFHCFLSGWSHTRHWLQEVAQGSSR